MNKLLKLGLFKSNFIFPRFISSSIGTRQRVDFYYDVVSPYSWFAFEALHRYKKEWNIDLKLIPVLLGGIFQNTKNVSPLVVSPIKVKHLRVDLVRNAKYFGIGFTPMKDMNELLVKGSLAPMRCLTACELFYPEYTEKMSRAFWIKRFQQDQDFTSKEAITEVIKQVSSDSDMDLVADFFTKMQLPEVKDLLKNNTIMAPEKYGIFGVPSIVLRKNDSDHELFFGSDRLHLLAIELGKEWRGPNPIPLST